MREKKESKCTSADWAFFYALGAHYLRHEGNSLLDFIKKNCRGWALRGQETLCRSCIMVRSDRSCCSSSTVHHPEASTRSCDNRTRLKPSQTPTVVSASSTLLRGSIPFRGGRTGFRVARQSWRVYPTCSGYGRSLFWKRHLDRNEKTYSA